MRESCTAGSVRRASSDRRLYSTLHFDLQGRIVSLAALSRFEPPAPLSWRYEHASDPEATAWDWMRVPPKLPPDSLVRHRTGRDRGSRNSLKRPTFLDRTTLFGTSRTARRELENRLRSYLATVDATRFIACNRSERSERDERYRARSRQQGWLCAMREQLHLRQQGGILEIMR